MFLSLHWNPGCVLNGSYCRLHQSHYVINIECRVFTRNNCSSVNHVICHNNMSIWTHISERTKSVMLITLADRNRTTVLNNRGCFYKDQYCWKTHTFPALKPQTDIILVLRGLEVLISLLLGVDKGSITIVTIISSLRHFHSV